MKFHLRPRTKMDIHFRLKNENESHLIILVFFLFHTFSHHLPRWLSWLRHSAHRPGRSVGGARVQLPGRPADFVFGLQGRML